MADLGEMLRDLDFGRRTAEEEVAELGEYFVETVQWGRLRSGQCDVVYGPKGAGKSAIHAVLVARREELSLERIIVKDAEQPQGETAFAEILQDPPESEAQWRVFWRAYFVCLVADVLEEERIEVEAAKAVLSGVEQQGLRSGKGIKAALLAARELARHLADLKGIEAGAGVDAAGGFKLSGKLELGQEARRAIEAASAVSRLLEAADNALQEADLEVWIALDRLDAAFSEPHIEIPALRALMRVYLDFTKHKQITPKIFLRSDIWNTLVLEQGFREASHITRSETIAWNRDSLLHVAMRRAMGNEGFREWFGADKDELLASVTKQEELFEGMFAVPGGGFGEFPTMLDWAIGATGDGWGRSTPREIIHLLDALRDRQIERLGVGRPGPGGLALFEVDVLAPALREVSETHLAQTFYAENPKYRTHVEALRGGSAKLTLANLEQLWGEPSERARIVAEGLVRLGMLGQGGGPEAGFEVAMLYRPALDIVDEVAEGGNGHADA